MKEEGIRVDRLGEADWKEEPQALIMFKKYRKGNGQGQPSAIERGLIATERGEQKGMRRWQRKMEGVLAWIQVDWVKRNGKDSRNTTNLDSRFQNGRRQAK